MKIYRFYFLVIILNCFPILVGGQSDTTLHVPEIKVTAERVRTQIIGGTTKTWKTDNINEVSANNVGELLQKDGGIFIKSYGMGSLATSSIRGGNAGQTLVLWNGLPIQSPMLGLLDLSLLPLGGTEEISLQKGGNGSMWGSGAIGGVISMNNKNDFSNKFNFGVKMEMGSFGYLGQQFRIGVGNSKFQSITKFFHQSADNDFPFQPAPSLPDQKQTNAHYSRQNVLQDFYWKINPQLQLSTHFWRQWSVQEIPPTTVQNSSIAIQKDNSTRGLVNLKSIFSNGHVQAKAGYFDENNIFNDGPEFINHFINYFGELEFQWNFNSYNKIVVGSTYSLTEAESGGYPENIIENRSAFFVSHFFHQNKWKIQTSLRQAAINGKSVPFIPNLGIDYALNSIFNIKAKVGRNYRLPTLNDRYWAPGGNIDLLPESGWNQELGIQSEHKVGDLLTNVQVTGFNRKINNWIMWANVDGSFFWSAVNVEKVWSRGLEFSTSLIYKKDDWHLQCDFGGNYILSTTEFDLVRPKMRKGTQLFYTPKVQATTKFRIGWKNLNLLYDHSFTSYSRGVNESVDSYLVANASLNYSFKNKKSRNDIFFRVNNIWDTDYYVIERRPLPGIHYQAGINFNFYKKSKSQQ